MNHSVSVVIPARDSQDTIHRTIESLAHQTRRPDEVIVVAGNGDLTRMALKDYIENGFVRIMEVDPPAHMIRDAHWKRREGAKIAKGDVIFFTDSKVILEEHAIQRALELMDQYNVMAVAGISPAWPDQASNFVAKVHDKALVRNNPEFSDVGFLTEKNFGRTESLPVTSVLMMTRQAFERIRDDFGVEFSAIASTYDDYVIAWLLVKSGITILVTNRVIGYHKHRLKWKDYVGQISRSGQSAAVMVHQYPDCPFGKRRLTQALVILGLTVASLITAITSTLALGFTAIWIITTLAIGGYIILGIANAIKAKDVWGFLIPPFTAVLIFTFVFHFTKGWVKNGRFEPKEVKRYLQIH
jgi:cellulose synthase/poly-beta-1,6-N-acetylglucosamine synthase-like glycosyltransferase